MILSSPRLSGTVSLFPTPFSPLSTTDTTGYRKYSSWTLPIPNGGSTFEVPHSLLPTGAQELPPATVASVSGPLNLEHSSGRSNVNLGVQVDQLALASDDCPDAAEPSRLDVTFQRMDPQTFVKSSTCAWVLVPIGEAGSTQQFW